MKKANPDDYGENWASAIVDDPADAPAVEELAAATEPRKDPLADYELPPLERPLTPVEEEILRRIQNGELIETNLSTLPGSGNRPPGEPSDDQVFAHDKEKKAWKAVGTTEREEYDQLAQRILDASRELNTALALAFKRKEMRVFMAIPTNKETGEWQLPLQMYPQIFRFTHGLSMVELGQNFPKYKDDDEGAFAV